MVKHEDNFGCHKRGKGWGKGCYWREVSRSQRDAAEHLRMQKDSSPQQRIIQSHISSALAKKVSCQVTYSSVMIPYHVSAIITIPILQFQLKLL